MYLGLIDQIRIQMYNKLQIRGEDCKVQGIVVLIIQILKSKMVVLNTLLRKEKERRGKKDKIKYKIFHNSKFSRQLMLKDRI